MTDTGFVYVFVVCPNNSGSTLIVELLRTSPHTATFDTANREGQWLAKTSGRPLMPMPSDGERRNWTINPPKFQDPGAYDWERLKTVWADAWGPERRVRVEKTPSMVLSAPLFEEQFDGAYFILSLRDPYAFCEGVRRREGHDIATAARHWVACARHQRRNRAVLTRNIFFSYEELCAAPQAVAGRLTSFAPALGELNAAKPFEVFFRRSRIRNLNGSQVQRLKNEDISAINDVLDTDPAIVAEWGYARIEPGRQHSPAPPAAVTAGLEP